MAYGGRTILLLEIGQASATMATIIIIYYTVLYPHYYYSVHKQNKKSNLK